MLVGTVFSFEQAGEVAASQASDLADVDVWQQRVDRYYELRDLSYSVTGGEAFDFTRYLNDKRELRELSETLGVELVAVGMQPVRTLFVNIPEGLDVDTSDPSEAPLVDDSLEADETPVDSDETPIDSDEATVEEDEALVWQQRVDRYYELRDLSYSVTGGGAFDFARYLSDKRELRELSETLGVELVAVGMQPARTLFVNIPEGLDVDTGDPSEAPTVETDRSYHRIDWRSFWRGPINRAPVEETGDRLKHYLGLTVEEGRALAKSEGMAFRVTSRDGIGQAVTADLRSDRVSAKVEDGVISFAAIH